MNEMYKLENTIKHYDWGSPDWIPRLTGRKNPDNKPWAELWMGVHPQGPSQAIVDGKLTPLSDLVKLPFLLKYLAAEKPLSIQAHPNAEQARAGFEKENALGIPLEAPDRNYKDPNHKPEIICALGPFAAMAGFREPDETDTLLRTVSGTDPLRKALKDGYQSFLKALFDSPDFPDPGVLSPLYLNVIELQPYEALFIPAGILHAYVHGFALECMANSDNVLRGGLTSKHIDKEELFSILDFAPYKPKPLICTSTDGEYKRCFAYQSPCHEFTLYRVEGDANIPVCLNAKGDAVITVTQGSAECLSGGYSLKLNQGESAFIRRRLPDKTISFAGDFILFAALAPE